MKIQLFGFVFTFNIHRAQERPIQLTCVRCGAPVSDNGEYYCPACIVNYCRRGEGF